MGGFYYEQIVIAFRSLVLALDCVVASGVVYMLSDKLQPLIKYLLYNVLLIEI